MKSLLFSFVLMFSGALFAQDAPAPAKKYEPTEIESLHLSIKQKDAIIAQKDLTVAQQQMQQAMAAIAAEAEVVKKAHGWDASVIFNPSTMAFSDPPKPPQKPAPPK